jgi:hypothetical protein
MFNGYVSKLFDLLKNASLVPSSNHISDWPTQLSTIRSILNNGSNLYFFEKFADVGSPNSTEIFRNESVKCWTYMRRIRVSAICLACSGKSSRFFMADKGLVQPEVCQRSLENCLSTLRYSFRFIRMMKWLYYLEQLLNTQTFISLNTDSVFDRHIVKIAADQLKTGNLSDLVSGLSRDNITSHQLEIHVCKRFLSLGSIPFIHYLDKIFVNKMAVPIIGQKTEEATMITNSATTINNAMPQLNTDLSTILSNWKNANKMTLTTTSATGTTTNTTIITSPTRRLRMLQTVDDSTLLLNVTDQTQLFTSDVVFATSLDSLYTTDPSTTTQVTSQPLNMTLTFP